MLEAQQLYYKTNRAARETDPLEPISVSRLQLEANDGARAVGANDAEAAAAAADELAGRRRQHPRSKTALTSLPEQKQRWLVPLITRGMPTRLRVGWRPWVLFSEPAHAIYLSLRRIRTD